MKDIEAKIFWVLLTILIVVTVYTQIEIHYLKDLIVKVVQGSQAGGSVRVF